MHSVIEAYGPNNLRLQGCVAKRVLLAESGHAMRTFWKWKRQQGKEQQRNNNRRRETTTITKIMSHQGARSPQLVAFGTSYAQLVAYMRSVHVGTS